MLNKRNCIWRKGLFRPKGLIILQKEVRIRLHTFKILVYFLQCNISSLFSYYSKPTKGSLKRLQLNFSCALTPHLCYTLLSYMTICWFLKSTGELLSTLYSGLRVEISMSMLKKTLAGTRYTWVLNLTAEG